MNLHKLKNKAIREFCFRTWRMWEILGLHVSPNHFYWPIPDTKDVLRYDFDKKFTLDGIKIDDSRMQELLKKLAQYKSEYSTIHTDSAYTSNGDGAVLYSMVREFKPKKILEVGSGFSTCIAWAALQRNKTEDGKSGSIIAIEPYPKPVLKSLVSKSGSDVTLLQTRVEETETQLFDNLTSGDILFIDSSHVIKIGNDVHYLFLSVLPKVPPGIIIHFHDIRFPYDYPKRWVLKAKKFWSEQYLLQMFLAFNDTFEILFASNYMYDKYPELMVDSLVGLNNEGDGWPGSFWIRRKD